MKVGVIIFHKNIYSIYDKKWVDTCLDSIRNQTHKEFMVYELCYSDKSEQLWTESDFEHRPLENHIFAMNHIIDKAFADGCDVVANTNLDDYFSLERLEIQIASINEGYDLISSNFTHINDMDDPIRDMIFHDKDISAELSVNHNIICHSCVLMTKGFWNRNKYYETNELGYEDMNLWKRAISNAEKIIILPQILLYYRLHQNQTGRINQCNL